MSVNKKQTLLKRTLSVTQEFSARLISLAEESESVPFAVEDIPGPWQSAILSAEKRLGDQKVLVYLDPPYTRDEYSRYYHVLETLVHYNYPEVASKSAVPTKGSVGRYASEFFTWKSSVAEDAIAKIIGSCLERNWSCLWSYSSSGMADIEKVIKLVGARASSVEIYKAKYAYRPQGRKLARPVDEYMIYLCP